MKICRLSAADRKAFCALFAEYYQELGCDEDIDHLLDEYVLADFDAGLLDIAVAQEGGAAFGFVIWQPDRAENDWCLREGMGTVRELFVAPSFRGRGTGSALTAFAESDIAALPNPTSPRQALRISTFFPPKARAHSLSPAAMPRRMSGAKTPAAISFIRNCKHHFNTPPAAHFCAAGGAILRRCGMPPANYRILLMFLAKCVILNV